MAVDEPPWVETLAGDFAPVVCAFAVVDLALDQVGNLGVFSSVAISETLLALLDQELDRLSHPWLIVFDLQSSDRLACILSGLDRFVEHVGG